MVGDCKGVHDLHILGTIRVVSGILPRGRGLQGSATDRYSNGTTRFQGYCPVVGDCKNKNSAPAAKLSGFQGYCPVVGDCKYDLVISDVSLPGVSGILPRGRGLQVIYRILCIAKVSRFRDIAPW